MPRSLYPAALALAVLFSSPFLLHAQNPFPEVVQVGPPPIHRVEPPSPSASADELEQRGDELRAEKNYLDALDYYRDALSKDPRNARVLNKIGIVELSLQNFGPAKKSFEASIKRDPRFADAYNNLGVVFYAERKYGKAISRYDKALKLKQDSAAFYSNLGAAYFSKRDFDKAIAAYSQAAELDPDIFEHSAPNGIAARMSSPEDRAHYDFVLARLFAKQGDDDRSLLYLGRAMEEGYPHIDAVYKDSEFAGLRKDARFTQLMASKPPAITE